MSWQHRLPHGISGFRQIGQGFEASVSIPADEEGFFGRQCPDCERFFKMQVEQWEALPDAAIVTCPYCGHQPEDVNDFMTPQQNQRVQSAAEALAEQYMHQTLQKVFSGLRTRRLRPGESGIEIRVSRDGLELLARPEDLHLLPEESRTPGTIAALRLPKEQLGMSPGFYMALGNRDIGSDGPGVVDDKRELVALVHAQMTAHRCRDGHLSLAGDGGDDLLHGHSRCKEMVSR